MERDQLVDARLEHHMASPGVFKLEVDKSLLGITATAMNDPRMLYPLACRPILACADPHEVAPWPQEPNLP